MRPRIISLTCLLMVATLMAAQSIRQHEYWIDSDYSSRQTISSGNTVSITVSTAELSPGVHFLNHRALDTDDNWGVLSRMLFYVPDVLADNVKVSSYEYWIDSDYANAVKKETSDVNQAFTIDISQLSAGVHFLNFRTIDSNGKYGQLSRSVFYIPVVETEAYIAEYQYWIDYADPIVQEVNKVQSVFSLTLDLSGLSDGQHTFSFQAKGRNGIWGDLFTKTFLVGENDDIIAMIETEILNPSMEHHPNMDINHDGVVNVADIVEVVKIINSGNGTGSGYFWMGNYMPKSNTFPSLNGKEVEGIVTTYTSLDDAMAKASRAYSANEYAIVMYPSSWGVKDDLVFLDSANKKYYATKQKNLSDFPDYLYYESTDKIGANATITLSTEVVAKAAGATLFSK